MYKYKSDGKDSTLARVMIEGDHLKVYPSGMAPVQLHAIKKDWFYMKGRNTEVEFIRDAVGKIIEHIIHGSPSDYHYKKMK